MKKYVLTGAPSSGKSSIILSLEYDLRKPVLREAAEDIIKFHQAKGLDKPWTLPNFQDMILELHLYRESLVEKAKYEEVFLDRGILDGLAYYQLMGREPTQFMKTALRRMRTKPYEKVFLVEMLGTCETNQIRREDQEEAAKLERLQGQNYRDYGYEPIRISPGTIDERVRQMIRNTT